MARLPTDSVLELVLADSNPEVLHAWRLQFERYPEVRIHQGSVLEAGAAAVLCPGNAFGFMDGGLALHLSEALGWHLQDQLRERVRAEFDGEILVGQASPLATGGQPPWLIYAPTVRTPGPVGGTVNAYLALRAALLAIRRLRSAAGAPNIASLAVPGLCTGAGGMNPHVSARQLRYAFEVSTGKRGFGDKNLSQLTRREAKMKALPGSLLEGDE